MKTFPEQGRLNVILKLFQCKASIDVNLQNLGSELKNIQGGEGKQVKYKRKYICYPIPSMTILSCT